MSIVTVAELHMTLRDAGLNDWKVTAVPDDMVARLHANIVIFSPNQNAEIWLETNRIAWRSMLFAAPGADGLKRGIHADGATPQEACLNAIVAARHAGVIPKHTPTTQTGALV